LITSTANDSVKYVRSLQRRRFRYEEKSFLAEGLRTVEEAIQAGLRPAFLLHTPALAELPRAHLLLSQAEIEGIPVRAVSEPVMAAMSDTVTPAGILAVLPMSESALPQPLTWALVLDRVRDPGNLGTILRSALAAGVELVIASRGTVDVYSPKVVRAAMGAHFRLSFRLDQPWTAIQDLLKGLRVFGARPRAASPYWQMDWRQPTALWIGGEAEGASPEAEKLITDYVTIPMRENVESLNTAVAAGILLFEAARQRFSGDGLGTNPPPG
jgi:TrmH family RNA methyltransferase